MNRNKVSNFAKKSQGLSKPAAHVCTQTSGISVDNLIGGLHLNLTQPECTDRP